ncbi:thiol reductant ABC exporter subunit CydD [Vagococcus entomophilus]|uniref:Thiol reductant ABC exporter subunit CydD n=1 Tax=Vagococcus entomophilus TaxID=1160095 RepID=A0A430AFX0_9ENTE|nr:thiol reductant ABC exporter subunit CydD [Vagococcus entomophilus]RSU06637.1 thiol reductant ABC exporter subunit CydD [Vagococcus entomophilus]
MMDKNLFRIEKMRAVLGGLAGLAVLQALFIIGQAYFLSKGITNLWNGGKVGDQLVEVGLFFLFFMLRQACQYIRDKSLDTYAYRESQAIRQKFMKKLFVLGPNFVQKEGTGNMVTMAIEGISQIENYITLILPKITNMMIIPWIIAAFLFTQDILSGVIVLLVFPIIIVFMIILGYAAKAKADKQYEGFQRLSNHFIDALRGLETLKLLGLSKKYEKNVYQVSEDYRKATMSTLKIAILSTFALDFFTTLSVAVVAVFLGLKLINGGIALLPALLVLVLTPDFFLPLRDFSNDYHATLNGGNTLKAIFRILDQAEPKKMATFPLSKTYGKDDSIALEKASVSYQTNEQREKIETLKDLSFEWQGYGKVGVVGLSGSGKSTLIKLLGGFLEPTSDEMVTVNHQFVANLAQKSWQEQLFYLPQDPYIFHASLRENLSFYVPNASEEEMIQAVEHAGLTELISELPKGLDTVIGEGGQTLSGGQTQRVALARIFLDQSRKILLFDEPTAHLDIETEAELKKTMLPLFSEHLVFFATHRLHWMKEMDYILVMDQGKLVEAGTYEEVSQNDGFYRKLVNGMKGVDWV